MKPIRVGVDLAKNFFQVHDVDRTEKLVWRRKLSRADDAKERANGHANVVDEGYATWSCQELHCLRR